MKKKQTFIYSKRTTLLPYLIVVLITAFLLFAYFDKRNRYIDTISTGRKMKTRVIDLSCTGGTGRSRLYFKNERREVQHVNVSHQDCQRYKTGDTIEVYVSKEGDWYEIDPASQTMLDPRY